MSATFILAGETQRLTAARAIHRAPLGYVVTIAEPARTTDQNSKLWAMLTDVARSRPLGREHTADVWKMLFMQACGHESQFEMGLDNKPFPVGFRSSKLTKRQMGDLISFIDAWGSANGVRWTDLMPDAEAIEARSAGTARPGPKDESAVAKPSAQRRAA